MKKIIIEFVFKMYSNYKKVKYKKVFKKVIRLFQIYQYFIAFY